MSELIRQAHLDHVDDVYQQLLQMHEGLDEAQSLKVCAKLILTLANHIGDSAVVMEAIELARRTPSLSAAGRG
ncbi:DUF2783 domain-containing protein [Comamonas sp. lk]|uniref:DUF2783 domain-containing protein n=1 Tax=Comamonas sp. lk TaxID=2201272 RepID=UPI000EB128B1|nr:DUF2783 domain-containing protein [Comamonas sp. lk]